MTDEPTDLPRVLGLPIPRTPRGLALLCSAATALIAAGVANLLLLGQGIQMSPARVLSIPASFAAGLVFFYLGHCAMQRPAP